MPKPIGHREKIKLTDTVMDIAVKLSEGNPGAVTVIVQLIKDAARIDPQSFLGALTPLLSLDSHGIYGSNIWVLYKDLCNQSVLDVMTVLRSVQMGLISEADLWNHIDNGTRFDVVALYTNLRQRLPSFNPEDRG